MYANVPVEKTGVGQETDVEETNVAGDVTPPKLQVYDSSESSKVAVVRVMIEPAVVEEREGEEFEIEIGGSVVKKKPVSCLCLFRWRRDRGASAKDPRGDEHCNSVSEIATAGVREEAPKRQRK